MFNGGKSVFIFPHLDQEEIEILVANGQKLSVFANTICQPAEHLKESSLLSKAKTIIFTPNMVRVAGLVVVDELVKATYFFLNILMLLLVER